MIGIWLLVLVIGCLIWVLQNNYLETFVDYTFELIKPNGCPNELVYDGSNYYLINSSKPYDGVNNPLKFGSLQEVDDYLDSIQCPKLDPLNIVVSKNNNVSDDVTVPYERACNKKTALINFDENICNNYMTDIDVESMNIYTRTFQELTEHAKLIEARINSNRLIGADNTTNDLELKEVNERIDKLSKDFYEGVYKDKRISKNNSDYNLESCMINTIRDENKDLDDKGFADKFAKYFNNLNENIGQEYLYI